MRLASMFSVFVVGLAGLVFAHSSGPLLAQASSEPVCMSGKLKGSGKTFTFYVASTRVSQLQANGFVSVSCDRAKESFTVHRQRICDFVHSTPAPVQQAFQDAHGIAASTLCQLAEEVK